MYLLNSIKKAKMYNKETFIDTHEFCLPLVAFWKQILTKYR